jgi:hypothetical protein
MASKKNVIEFEGMQFKCFSLIEYSSLIELLKLLAKKYKNVDDKINILDQRMIEKDKRISELEIMLKGVSQSTENKFPSLSDKDKEKDDKVKEKEKEKKDVIEDLNITEEEKKSEENKDDILDQKHDDNENQNLNQEKDSNMDKSQSQFQKKEKEENENLDENDNRDENKEEEKEKEDITENNIDLSPKEISSPKNLNTDNKGYNSGFNSGNIIDEMQDSSDKGKGEENKELFSKILKKLKAHERQINDLLARNNEFLIINKSIKLNKNEVEELERQFRALKNNISDINRKMLGYNDDLEKIKVKVTDFDVFDLFKGGEGGDVDLDAAKILIKNLENKIAKKFEIYDERNKKMDKDVYKMQEDVKNSLAIVDGMKTKTDRNAELLDELSQKYENKISEVDNTLSELDNKIEIINSKIKSKPDFSNIKKDFEKKLKDLEDKLNSKLDLFLNSNNNNDSEEKEKYNKEKNEILAIIKELRKRIGELEKNTSVMFDQINADEIKKRIKKLETEIDKKAGKYEFQELTDKLRSLDEFVKDLNFKQDSLQQFTEKVRMDLAQIIKKIEFLSGEYSKLTFNKSGQESDDGLSNVDLSKFLDLNTFNDNKRDVNSKFEKVRLGFEDLSREIEEILSKLSHTPTDKDFLEFQNIVKNLLDELKISSNKKYADKIETSKSIKFLETQIRTLHDAFYKKNEAGDNWLLAKKPINNYVCASCEANIRGELDKRTEFVPWNRYPQRDDKAYRIGHGFSRMLQMVNEDIIKNAGDKAGYSSDEDNKKSNIKANNSIINNDKNYPVNTSVKLPKVTRKKPLLSGTSVTEPNNNVSGVSPYDDAENGENNDTNKIQIMRVIRKNKLQSESSARDNIYKNNENASISVKKTLSDNMNTNINTNTNDNEN